MRQAHFGKAGKIRNLDKKSREESKAENGPEVQFLLSASQMSPTKAQSEHVLMVKD